MDTARSKRTPGSTTNGRRYSGIPWAEFSGDEGCHVPSRRSRCNIGVMGESRTGHSWLRLLGKGKRPGATWFWAGVVGVL